MSQETPGTDARPLPASQTEGAGAAGEKAGTTQEATEAIRAQTQGGRLGGARADFVASLGRKVSDCRTILKALERDSGARTLRDDLRRKLHALAAGARLLRFEALANARRSSGRPRRR